MIFALLVGVILFIVGYLAIQLLATPKAGAIHWYNVLALALCFAGLFTMLVAASVLAWRIAP